MERHRTTIDFNLRFNIISDKVNQITKNNSKLSTCCSGHAGKAQGKRDWQLFFLAATLVFIVCKYKAFIVWIFLPYNPSLAETL